MSTQPPVQQQSQPQPQQSMLLRLAQVYLKRQQDKLGITARNDAEQQQQLAELVKRAQLRKLTQEMDLAPAEQTSQINLRTAQTEAAHALADQREIPKPAKSIERTIDLGDKVRIIHSDGSISEEPKGAAPAHAGAGGADGSFAANPFQVTDPQGNVRLAVRVKGGGYQFVDNIGGTKVGPGPTAEQRNVDYQAQAVEPAFDLLEQDLNALDHATQSLGGKIKGVVPGTDANFAKTRFIDQAKALLGAIVARQSGEGSRLSDEDRKSYSQASTLVNNLLLLPGGVQEARDRMAQARQLLSDIAARRRMGGAAPGAAPTPTPAPNGSGGGGGGGSFRVVGVRR